MAKAAYALGAYEMNDDKKIDNYLALAECKMFNEFYADDFSWREIRNTMRSHIQMNAKSFPLKFEYLQPVIFETYDFEKQAFPLSADTAFRSNTKLQVSGNNIRAEPCAEPLLLMGNSGIPPNAMLVLKAPLELRMVPVPKEKADAYIKSLAVRKGDERERRKVFARFRIELSDYLGETVIASTERYMQFDGTIKEVAFFSDMEQTDELYKFMGQPPPDIGLPPVELPSAPAHLQGN